jgi:hypothetical protein
MRGIRKRISDVSGFEGNLRPTNDIHMRRDFPEKDSPKRQVFAVPDDCRCMRCSSQLNDRTDHKIKGGEISLAHFPFPAVCKTDPKPWNLFFLLISSRKEGNSASKGARVVGWMLECAESNGYGGTGVQI